MKSYKLQNYLQDVDDNNKVNKKCGEIIHASTVYKKSIVQTMANLMKGTCEQMITVCIVG